MKIIFCFPFLIAFLFSSIAFSQSSKPSPQYTKPKIFHPLPRMEDVISGYPLGNSGFSVLVTKGLKPNSRKTFYYYGENGIVNHYNWFCYTYIYYDEYYSRLESKTVYNENFNFDKYLRDIQAEIKDKEFLEMVKKRLREIE